MTNVFDPVDDIRRSFADAVVDAFGRRPGPRFALMLSGGQTARDCYEVLAATMHTSSFWELQAAAGNLLLYRRVKAPVWPPQPLHIDLPKFNLHFTE